MASHGCLICVFLFTSQIEHLFYANGNLFFCELLVPTLAHLFLLDRFIHSANMCYTVYHVPSIILGARDFVAS